MQRFGLDKKKAMVTTQSEKIKGREEDMRENNAGGFSFKLDKWKRLERFLVLGTEGGTYYVSEKKLDKQNTKNLTNCLSEDYKKTIDIIKEISHSGRTIKNDTAIFALAVAASHPDIDVRRYALKALPSVCRIGTHLFHFAEFVDSMRGWGKAIRRAVGKWYTDRSDENLALQLLKYKQRDGWSHRDVLLLSHVKPLTEMQNNLFKAAAGKEKEWPEAIALCKGYNELQKEQSLKQSIEIIKEYKLPRELVKTELLNEKATWLAMLPTMPMTALIRNLGKMASLDILQNLSPSTKIVEEKLTDEEAIKKSRVHPMAILNAIKVYSSGRNITGAARGRIMNWTPCTRVSAALEKAFYHSFKNVESTNKNIFLALDVSGSMTSPISGGILSCREASALMAMVTARVEPNYDVYGFTMGRKNEYCVYGGRGAFSNRAISPIQIRPNMDFDTIIKTVSGLPFSGTDCALPIMFALEKRMYVDVFCVYTDSETWAGTIQPSQALARYRQQINPKAKMVVVGMTANNISIADPEDAGMLDVAGFDPNTPAVISDFIRD